MPRSLDDIFTTAQNIVTAINTMATTWRQVAGTATSSTVDATTLVASGTGRLVSVSIIDAGSGDGLIYNSANATSLLDGAKLMVVPTGTEGIFPAGLLYNLGLVIVPGTGQILNITYSPDKN